MLRSACVLPFSARCVDRNPSHRLRASTRVPLPPTPGLEITLILAMSVRFYAFASSPVGRRGHRPDRFS
jgi:hypothetical protein